MKRCLAYLRFSSILSFAAFWCACLVKGTVLATLLVFPALGAVPWAFGAAYPIAFKTQAIWSAAASRLHPFPFAPSTRMLIEQNLPWMGVWLLIPLIAVAAIQSYRLFRREIYDSFPSIIRHLLLLLITAFLSGVVVFLPYVIERTVDGQMYKVLLDVYGAVQKMQIDPGKLDPAHPLEMRIDDIARISPLSDNVRRWTGLSSLLLRR